MVQYVNIDKTLDVKYGDRIDRETSLKLGEPVTYNRNADVYSGEEEEGIGNVFTYKFKKNLNTLQTKWQPEMVYVADYGSTWNLLGTHIFKETMIYAVEGNESIYYVFTLTVNVTSDTPKFTIRQISDSYGSFDTFTILTVDIGTNLTLRYTPKESYRVIGFNDNDVIISQTSNTYELVNIQSDHTVRAITEKIKFTITTSAGANGEITPSATVEYGTNKTINITPNTGYEIEKVIVDDTNKGKITSYTFNNIKENHTISATFKKLDEQKFTVNCTTVQNGNISVSPTSATVGTKITIYVNPSEGYRLKQIDSSPTVNINNNQFTMPAQNVTLTPVFEKIETQTYAITVGTSEHGTATASHTSASAGTTITMTATPGQGYVLKSYATQPYVSVVNGQFVMPSSPITVTPIFDVASIVKTSYDIYVSTETTDRGDVSVTGVDETKGIISIRAEAEPGYRFSEWEISNGVCFLSSPYTSETLMIIQDSDVSVVAHFVKDILPTKVNQVHLTITR